MTNLFIIALLLITIISNISSALYTKKCIDINNKVLENDNYRMKIFKKVIEEKTKK